MIPNFQDRLVKPGDEVVGGEFVSGSREVTAGSRLVLFVRGNAAGHTFALETAAEDDDTKFVATGLSSSAAEYIGHTHNFMRYVRVKVTGADGALASEAWINVVD